MRSLVLLAMPLILASPAFAGPPYLTDDPEPTETGHWENYLFIEGARAAGNSDTPMTGVEINYGPFENTQFTVSLPLNDNGATGIGTVWAPIGIGVKYRFIEEDDDGWRPQVAFFPSISIPAGHTNKGEPVTELFPIWLQKSFGTWTVFGGGGISNNPGPGNYDPVNYGLAVQKKVTGNLALGVEIFGAGKASVGERPTTAVGMAAIYDFSDLWHLVGSVNTGIHNARDADQFSYSVAVKWTP